MSSINLCLPSELFSIVVLKLSILYCAIVQIQFKWVQKWKFGGYLVLSEEWGVVCVWVFLIQYFTGLSFGFETVTLHTLEQETIKHSTFKKEKQNTNKFIQKK